MLCRCGVKYVCVFEGCDGGVVWLCLACDASCLCDLCRCAVCVVCEGVGGRCGKYGCG